MSKIFKEGHYVLSNGQLSQIEYSDDNVITLFPKCRRLSDSPTFGWDRISPAIIDQQILKKLGFEKSRELDGYVFYLDDNDVKILIDKSSVICNVSKGTFSHNLIYLHELQDVFENLTTKKLNFTDIKCQCCK